MENDGTSTWTPGEVFLVQPIYPFEPNYPV